MHRSSLVVVASIAESARLRLTASD
jgi:hypothetical protein